MAPLIQRMCYCDPCLLLFALWCLLCLGFQPLSRATWSSSGSHSQLPQNTWLPWHSGAPLPCVSLCAEGHLVPRYVWHAWGHLAWHHSLPAISGPESKIGTYSFLQRILSDWGTEILIYWNKIYVCFHYRSPCWKIKGEITHYRRTTVTFTLKVRSKRFCNYRGWDKWDSGDKYERQTQELNNFSMRNICLIKF